MTEMVSFNVCLHTGLTVQDVTIYMQKHVLAYFSMRINMKKVSVGK